MRVGLVHDWLTGMRGGEKVLREFCELLPQADLLTLIHRPGSCAAAIERMRIITSPLNDLPGVGRYYRWLLPLMPLAVETLDARKYDLIISSSHCVAKGVIRSASSVHVCYCHTPLRYAWSHWRTYHDNMGLAGAALGAARGYLRAWDRRSAGHVDCFIANSRNVAQRILTTYHRQARVIYPPVDTDFFTPGKQPREDFYLMVTALAPYKRVDQAIAAFAKLGRRLVIIGSGQQLTRLRREAPGNVQFLGWQPDELLRDHYRRCRALIFPGEEDFGIVPLEAMACGAAAIACGAGGALETVVDVNREDLDGPTGLLYSPQSAERLAAAVKRFEQVEDRFEPDKLVAWARRFGKARFIRQFKKLVAGLLSARGLPQPWSNAITN